MIPNCAATRHTHFVLDGSGPAKLEAPDLNDWPDITWEVGDSVRRVDLNTVTRADVKSWKTGETVLLSGKMLTGRDAAHKKMTDMLERRRKTAGRFERPLYLLRRSGRSGARRSRWPSRPDHRDAHG